MLLPGQSLRRFAVRVLPEATIRRVVDPVLADWQAEYEQAASRASTWERRWVRYSGYGILLRALVVYGCFRLAAPWHGWSSDDRSSLSRMLVTTAAATVALIGLLAYKPASDVAAHFSAPVVALLIPQAVPIAAPLGLLLGILYASRSSPLSRRLTRAGVVAAIVLSLGSFVLLNQVVPAANQAFRVAVFQELQLASGEVARPLATSHPRRGPAEMTFAELRLQVDEARRNGFSAESVRRLDFHLQQRRALAAAALPLAVFALVIGTRRRYRLFVLGVAGAGVTALYYTLMIASDQLTQVGAIPAVVVWLPHLGVLVLSAFFLAGPGRPTRFRSELA
jgi:lipopolysaccharide export LptBFGC system permease protein LptF